MNLLRLKTSLFISLISIMVAAQQPAILAVRMDDMGAFHSVNKAIMDIYCNGIAKSVEIMPVASWYPEAVQMLKNASGLDVGVHLTITSEWEILNGVLSLAVPH